ncbi:MAG: WXG100 family type VII secretion target [Pseudonocardiaceae bacterium]
MSGGFLVDVGALEQLITTLAEAADRMHVANDRLRAASAADLGAGDLDHAAGDFQDRWEYGIGKISDATEKMVDSLREAKELYEQTDQAIAGLFPDPGTGATPAATGSSPISRALEGGAAR